MKANRRASFRLEVRVQAGQAVELGTVVDAAAAAAVTVELPGDLQAEVLGLRVVLTAAADAVPGLYSLTVVVDDERTPLSVRVVASTWLEPGLDQQVLVRWPAPDVPVDELSTSVLGTVRPSLVQVPGMVATDDVRVFSAAAVAVAHEVDHCNDAGCFVWIEAPLAESTVSVYFHHVDGVAPRPAADVPVAQLWADFSHVFHFSSGARGRNSCTGTNDLDEAALPVTMIDAAGLVGSGIVCGPGAAGVTLTTTALAAMSSDYTLSLLLQAPANATRTFIEGTANGSSVLSHGIENLRLVNARSDVPQSALFGSVLQANQHALVAFRQESAMKNRTLNIVIADDTQVRISGPSSVASLPLTPVDALWLCGQDLAAAGAGVQLDEVRIAASERVSQELRADFEAARLNRSSAEAVCIDDSCAGR